MNSTLSSSTSRQVVPVSAEPADFAAGVVPVWTASDSCRYRLKEDEATAREKALESGWISTRYKVPPKKSPLKSDNRVNFPLQSSKGLIDWCNMQAGRASLWRSDGAHYRASCAAFAGFNS
jgi:hypothetical protein